MRATMSASIVRAGADDLRDVLALLAEVGLPAEGVAEHFGGFLVARFSGRVVGCVGLERHGDVALLRSLAVSPALQGGGLGRRLVTDLLEGAGKGGVRDVVLLTTAAADYFARRFGFAIVERRRFDAALANSPEWHLPRCSSAVCMHLGLCENR
jgi:amino-acid N-acetyltransferase